MSAGPFEFYESVPTIDRFELVGDLKRYVPLPDGWHIGVADVESSTKAIAAGRYKAVNMVGASVIAGVMNALGTRRFPFAFGGDGASIAVPGESAATTREALARVRRYARESLDLELRVGLVPIEAVRAAGHDVRVARLGVSKDVSFALFSGHGVMWAERELKAGRIGLPEAPAGAWPDLAGLSCRWEPIKARNGHIVSLIAVPAAGASDRQFADLVTRISSIVDAAPDRGVPLSTETMEFSLRREGIAIEASSRRGRFARWFTYLNLLGQQIAGYVVFASGRRVGNFDPDHYKRVSVANSDFRKFDDGLRMTLDCDAAVEARIRSALEKAHAQGIANYGLHVQDAALMTCLVPSVMTDDHMHFIDGAAGGYAEAAAMLKRQVAAPAKAA